MSDEQISLTAEDLRTMAEPYTIPLCFLNHETAYIGAAAVITFIGRATSVLRSHSKADLVLLRMLREHLSRVLAEVDDSPRFAMHLEGVTPRSSDREIRCVYFGGFEDHEPVAMVCISDVMESIDRGTALDALRVFLVETQAWGMGA
ncbi:MAG: hypothetical protein IT301_06670 [Dehalococcoidia bacterium]|nr:hypothetical protein [Dehalococcoidia bacterium]